MIVVDASALVDVLLRTQVGGRIETALFGAGRVLHAPHLVDIEVAAAFRRLVAKGDIDPERGRLMLGLLIDMPIRRHAHEVLLPRVWQLRENVTAYDAVYVALAEALGAPLLTRDGRLAKAAGPLVAIELV